MKIPEIVRFIIKSKNISNNDNILSQCLEDKIKSYLTISTFHGTLKNDLRYYYVEQNNNRVIIVIDNNCLNLNIVAFVAFESTLNGAVWQVQHMGCYRGITNENFIYEIFKLVLFTYKKSIQSKTNLNPYETKLWFDLLFTDLNLMLYDIKTHWILNPAFDLEYKLNSYYEILDQSNINNRLTWIINHFESHANTNLYTGLNLIFPYGCHYNNTI